MPDDLLDVDWAAVEHAYGPATDLPDLLRQLRSPAPDVRTDVAEEILDRVAHQESSYPAGAAIVPYLIDLFADETAPDRSLGWDLLARLLPAEAVPALDGPRLGALARRRSDLYLAPLWWPHPLPTGVEPVHQEIYDAVAAGIPAFLRLAGDEDRTVRAYSAHLLSFFPGHGDRIVPVLRARLAVEQDRVVGALLCLAAGLVGDPGDTALIDLITERRSSDRLGTRWTVLMGLVRLIDRPDRAMLKDLCDCLFEAPEPIEGWPFDNGDLSSGAASALATLPVHADPGMAALLLERLRAGGHSPARFVRALELLLSLSFPDGPLPEGAGLSPGQQAAVQVVLDSGLIEDVYVRRLLTECGV